MLRKSSYYEFDKEFKKNEKSLILGIDESGRGPLAGPLVVTGVILNPDFSHPEIQDSKKISVSKREELFQIIKNNSKKIYVEIIWEKDIDYLNILGSTIFCMKKILKESNEVKCKILIDGNKIIEDNDKIKFIVKGDSKSLSIAAASIIAKVTRDNLMNQYALIFPEYDLENNKGYGTKKHLDAIYMNGPTIIHRKSFNPTKKLIKSNKIYNIQKEYVMCERYAAIHLIRKGIFIEEFNYSKEKLGKISIIYFEGNKVIFSHILKMEKKDQFTRNLQLNIEKIKYLSDLFKIYCSEKGLSYNIRFDVICVTFISDNQYILKIKNGIKV